jgi:hypothetical protein
LGNNQTGGGRALAGTPLLAHARLARIDSEIGSVALQKLVGINKSVPSKLAQKGIVKRGKKRGTCEPSVRSDELKRATFRHGKARSNLALDQFYPRHVH